MIRVNKWGDIRLPCLNPILVKKKATKAPVDIDGKCGSSNTLTTKK